MKISVGVSVSESGRKRPEYTLNSDLSGELTLADLLQWTKSSLIVTADEVFKDAKKEGFDPNPTVFVDGRINKPVISVSPLGKIEFVAKMDFDDILLETYDGLLKRSKVKKGVYISSHYVFHNGKQVAIDMQSLTAWLESNPVFENKDTIRIVNIQPYARRLELLGVTAQRQQVKTDNTGRRKKKPGHTVKVPNGAYQLTTRAIKSKYKKNLSIRFTFLSGSSLGLSGNFKTPSRNRNGSIKSKSSGRPYLYPTIVFTVNDGGLNL